MLFVIEHVTALSKLLAESFWILSATDFSYSACSSSVIGGNKFKFDSLRHAQSRLNAYRGLASESYISLASIDPILTAFELGRELRDLSGKEKYFKVKRKKEERRGNR